MSVPGSASPLFLATAAAAAPAGPHQIDRSLRFNSADSPSLNRTPSSAGNRKTWTFSTWIKRTKLGDHETIFSADHGSGNWFIIQINNDDTLQVNWTAGTGGAYLLSDQVFRDPASWFHLVVAFDTTQSTAANRVKIYINGSQITSFSNEQYPNQNTDYQVNNTVIHKIGTGAWDADCYLAEMHLVDGTALAATDFAEEDSNGVWQPKAFSGTYGTNGFYLKFADNSSNAALGTDSSGNSNTWTVNNLSIGGQAFSEGITTTLDSNASYVASNAFDGSQSTSTRTSGTEVVLNVDFSPGVAVTSSVEIQGEQGFITPNCSITVSGTTTNSGGDPNTAVAGQSGTTTKTFSSVSGTLTNIKVGKISSGRTYLSRVLVDGVALIDGSPADNDSLLDTPSNYDASSGNNGGNYCTWNPLSTNSTPTFSEGNLTVTNSGSGASGWRNIASTMAVSSGKWYMEFDTVGSQNGGLMIGIQKVPEDHDQFNPASFSNNFVGMTANSYALNCFSGAKRTNSSDSGYGSGMSANDKIMMAVDLDNGKIWWGKNNSWFASGDPDSGTNAAFTGLSGTFVFAVGISASEKIHSNFGQRPYSYSNNISGFKSVCTQNFDESAYASIPDGSTAFDISLWTGNDATSRAITGLNFSPDFLWIKSRSAGGWHALADSVRGAGKILASNANNSEYNNSDSQNAIQSFDSNGFTIGHQSGWVVNNNNTTIVGWAWDAGTSAASSNTDGSITSNVMVNQSAGFSIVTYTGTGSTATIGHGLNAAPGLIIVKSRTAADGWPVYHQSLSNLASNYLVLHSTNAVGSITNYWNGTNSSVIGVLGGYAHSSSSQNYVAYCWAPVEGFSAFGSYTGNGSSDGPFVYTGFRPKLVIRKRTDSSVGWYIVDTERDIHNEADSFLDAADGDAESTSTNLDILSNGFKLRNPDAGTNASGGTYVYMAWAENPFRTARAR